jgi:outer membrane protein, protease secretion system
VPSNLTRILINSLTRQSIIRLQNSLVFTAALVLTEFAGATTANAMGLMEAYEAAVANDSVYRSATHENEAGQQFKVIGRANLLPNISANYGYNRNNQDIASQNNNNPISVTRNYNSENGSIQLRQPLINLESWARYNIGNAQTNLSDKQLDVSKQALITRFFGLFASANYAEDVLALAKAARDGFKLQEEANKLMAVRGEGTKIALIESQAKLSLSEAEVIEAEDSLTVSRNALATMLGKDVASLDMLTDGFNVQPMQPASLEEWREIALAHNPEMAAQREAVEVASQEVKRNRAGHAPRLDAIASISKSESDTTSTFKQEIDTKSIGLQLNIPIYAGGAVSALTTQAQANHLKAQDDLQTKTNEVLLDLHKQYSTLQSSTLKIDALKQSVASAELLVAATKKSLIGGVRTNLDVLEARKQLFETKRDLSLARYNYLVAYINLRKAAGTLTVTDLEKISPYFVQQVRNFKVEEDYYAAVP